MAKSKAKKPKPKQSYDIKKWSLFMLAASFVFMSKYFDLLSFFQHQDENVDKGFGLANTPCDAFSLIEGNLTTAAIILLGEIHEFQNLTVACMFYLAQSLEFKEHTVLYEASATLAELNDSTNTQALSAHCQLLNVDCISWDKQEVNQAVLNFYFQYFTHNYIKVFHEYLKSISPTLKNKILDECFKDKEKFKELTDYLVNKYEDSFANSHLSRDKLIQATIDKIGNLRFKQKLSYQQVFKHCFDELKILIGLPTLSGHNYESWQQLDEELLSGDNKVRLEHNRNVNLLYNIQKARKKNTPVLVQAGSHHIAYDTDMKAGSDYVRDELRKRKDDNPYAVLVMKKK